MVATLISNLYYYLYFISRSKREATVGRGYNTEHSVKREQRVQGICYSFVRKFNLVLYCTFCWLLLFIYGQECGRQTNEKGKHCGQKRNQFMETTNYRIHQFGTRYWTKRRTILQSIIYVFSNWCGIDEEDEIEILRDKKCEVLKYVNYVITVFWRVLWAFLPPENLGSGYPCFLICIVCIGAMTALIGKASIYLEICRRCYQQLLLFGYLITKVMLHLIWDAQVQFNRITSLIFYYT